MADVALGLAKTAVTGTVTLAKTAIEEEKKLKKSVQRDLMLISDELEMMQSFLHVANYRDGDDMSRTCVRQVRGMALDVEDCIETVVHLDNKPNWWRRLFPSFMAVAKPATDLDDAIAAIELLKVRVEAMGQRNSRYGFNSDSGGSNSKPAKQTHHHHVANSTASDIIRWVSKSDFTISSPFDVINEGAPGRQVMFFERIWRGLHPYSKRQVMSVWASDLEMPIEVQGYITRENCKKFACFAGVKVTSPLDLQGLVRSLLLRFKRSLHGSHVDDMKWMDTMSATDEEVVKEFRRLVSKQKYLVVLEDVSTMAEWDEILVLLPDMNNGSRIVVTTHQLEVAMLCIGSSWRTAKLDPSYVFYKYEHGGEHVTAKVLAARDRFNNFELVGREADVRAIETLIAPGHVICIWGFAGVGKTSLVRYIYDRALLKRPCYYSRFYSYSVTNAAWVNVSRPSNLMDLSRSILLDLYSAAIQCGEVVLRIRDPIQQCREVLRHTRCLVCLKGIQSAEELDSIKASLLSKDSQSAMIVTTNEESVAIKGTGWWEVYNVKGLEYGEAHNLFIIKMMGAREFYGPELVHKCGGLPGVICEVASVLRYNTQCLLDGNGFMPYLETKPEFQDLFAWIYSYFRSCPDSLKPCIFYMPIFPPELRIRRRRLVRRWIAEGYSRDTRDSTAEEAAEELFSKLVSLNMMRVQEQEVRRGGRQAFIDSRLLSWCQVNGFLREYILTRPMEENLVIELKSHCSMNSQRTGRHLTIQESWDRDMTVFETIDVSRLRSLTVFGEWDPFFISRSMELLRVLDLENSSPHPTHGGVTDNDVEEIVKRMPRLKFLSLRGCKQVERLPASFGDLRQLQTLDVRGTSIFKLPSCTSKLSKMQYLRAGATRDVSASQLEENGNGAPVEAPLRRWSFPALVSGWCRRRRPAGGVEVPARIGHLTGLRTLGVVYMNGSVEELKNLTQLHKLGVSGINRNNCSELRSVISKSAHLESLSVWFDKDNAAGCFDFDGMSPPPKNLRSLKLYGLQGKVPEWIKYNRNLRKVNLHVTTLTQEDADRLLSSTALEILSLSFEDFQGDILSFENGDGCHLLFFEIACNSSLHKVEFVYDTDSLRSPPMVNVKVLKIICRGECLTQFSGIDTLASLRELQLSGSYNQTLKVTEQVAKQILESPNDIKLVLKEESCSSHV